MCFLCSYVNVVLFVCIVMKGHIAGMNCCNILLAPFKLVLLSHVIYYGSYFTFNFGWACEYQSYLQVKYDMI